jgi:hypothetical protein
MDTNKVGHLEVQAGPAQQQEQDEVSTGGNRSEQALQDHLPHEGRPRDLVEESGNYAQW